jgi:hypothetical protein
MAHSQSGWIRSSKCESNTCVEVLLLPDQVLVRDSKNPDGAQLKFTPSEWLAFTRGVVAGDFSPSL